MEMIIDTIVPVEPGPTEAPPGRREVRPDQPEREREPIQRPVRTPSTPGTPERPDPNRIVVPCTPCGEAPEVSECDLSVQSFSTRDRVPLFQDDR